MRVDIYVMFGVENMINGVWLQGKYFSSVKVILPIIIVIIVFSVSCQRIKMTTTTLSINGRPLTVEIARTRKQRVRGLMHREELDWNRGMLFIFEEEKVLSFWMKNTKIPLSIAYLDSEGKVTDIFNMEPYSLQPVTSRFECKYALEVNLGFFRESGLLVGDRIDLDYLNKK